MRCNEIMLRRGNVGAEVDNDVGYRVKRIADECLIMGLEGKH